MKLHEKLYELLRCLVLSSTPADAISVLNTVLQNWPDLAVVHYDLGGLYYNTGQKEEALVHYEAAVLHAPENTTFQKNLADFYYAEQGRIQEGLEMYLNILEALPEDRETLIKAGHICVSLNRFDEAKGLYQRVLALEPWNSEIQANLKKLEDIDQGLTSFVSADNMYLDIRNHMHQKGPQETIHKLTDLLQQWPDYATAHNDLGVLYYNSGEKSKAVAHYEQAVAHQPENVTFKKNLADFYYVEQGRTEEALQTYVKILERVPEDIEALMATARICEGLKRTGDAKFFYNRILEIEPWNQQAMQKLETMASAEAGI